MRDEFVPAWWTVTDAAGNEVDISTGDEPRLSGAGPAIPSRHVTALMGSSRDPSFARLTRRIRDPLDVVPSLTLHYMARGPAQRPFSIRMSTHTLARLDERARRRSEPKARTAERLIDEGLRMEDHPGIVFRDGPTGRRAALAAGPDVWEVIDTLQGTGLAGDDAVTATAQWGNLTPVHVRAAVRYYAEYRDEVDERIRLNQQEADRQHAAWQRMQNALG